jgi:hypothetical protein
MKNYSVEQTSGLNQVFKDLLNGLYWNEETCTFETENKGKYTELYEKINALPRKQRIVIYYRFWRSNEAKQCNNNQGMSFEFIGMNIIGGYKNKESARKGTEKLYKYAIANLRESLMDTALVKERFERF